MAVLVASPPGLPVACPVLPLEAEIEQRGEPLVGLEDDVAAVSPVAARGAAAGSVLLPPERHGARPAVAGFDEDLGFVDELHDQTSRGPLRRAAHLASSRLDRHASARGFPGNTCTYVRSSAFFWYFTSPSTTA